MKKKFNGYKIVAMGLTSFCVLQDSDLAVTVSKNKHRGAIMDTRRTMCSRCKCLLSCILYMFKVNELAPNTCGVQNAVTFFVTIVLSGYKC